MYEELEKEADDYAEKHAFRVPYDGSNKFYDDVDSKASKEGYLAGAKPREKRIVELRDNYYQFKAVAEPEIERLKNENAELQHKVDTLQGYLVHDIEYDMDKTIQEQKIKITELEAQIEKMKVCQNCNNWHWKHNKCEKKLKGDCFKASKWILRR